VRTIHSVPVRELVELKKLTSTIQDAKRAAIAGKSSRWPDRMTGEFAKLAELSVGIPYAALDLEYLRDPSYGNRSFGYVITYDTFITPARDASGGPAGEPVLISVVKLGDGGRQDGYSAGKASGSIISRTVRSYWDEENAYNAMLQGVVIPGNDTGISRKIAKQVGGWELRIKGDVWHIGLLDRLSVEELLKLLEADAQYRDAANA
jgi:hypothetical protein